MSTQEFLFGLITATIIGTIPPMMIMMWVLKEKKSILWIPGGFIIGIYLASMYLIHVLKWVA